MTEKAAINIRVNKETKQNAEKVLNKLGIPMSVAIDMYLRQIALTDGIPFDLSSKKRKRKMITKQQWWSQKLQLNMKSLNPTGRIN